MGNCVVCQQRRLNHLRARVTTDDDDEHRSVLRVVKMDGKVVEFGAPILVKDLLVQFSGLSIGISEKASDQLPLDYELKIGKVYYFLPSPASPKTSRSISEEDSKEQGGGGGGGVKRIKVLITKQQLRDLLSKQTSVKEVLARIEQPEIGLWKPELEPIPEGSELQSSLDVRNPELQY